MCLGVRKMAGTSGITATNRAFLEMALENITSRKCISAENAHVWAVSSVYTVLDNTGGKKFATHVSRDVALDASHGGKSWYNEGREIFRQHL